MERPAIETVELSAPRVRFEPDFVRRIERFAARAKLARELREGAARSALYGPGAEFAGYRAYRPGDDPRRIDWDLLARSGRHYVRTTRREVASRWTLLLDASGSMGVGHPGKLQRACEVAAAVAAAALRSGAVVEVVASSRPARPFVLERAARFPELLAFLEAQEAHGASGLAAAAAEIGASRRASTLVALSDGLDGEPDQLVAARARALAMLLVLAPRELAPPAHGAARIVDPESGAELAVDLRDAPSYRRAVEARIERWRGALTAVRGAFAAGPTTGPFEVLAGTLLGM